MYIEVSGGLGGWWDDGDTSGGIMGEIETRRIMAIVCRGCIGKLY